MKGSIRRRSKDSWEITIDMGRDAQGKRLRKFVNVKGKKADADRRLRELLGIIDTGLPLDRGKMTVGEYIDQWLELHASKVRQRTIYGYRNVMKRYVLPSLGHMRLTQIQPGQIESLYTSQLKTGLSPRTVLQTHRILRRALKQAVRWNLIARNPLDLLDPPSFEKKEMPVLSVDQLTGLFEGASDSPYWIGIYIAAVTGMRRGELAGLKWQDIDFEHKVISVKREIVFVPGEGHLVTQPKSELSRRAIDISSTDVSELQRHRAAQAEQRLKLGSARTNEDWIITKEDGSHVNPNAITKAFKRIREDLGLPPVNLHSLRHTHATILLQQGVHLKVVQARLGHSTIAVTADTYSHVTSGLQRAAANAFEFALKKGDNKAIDASV